MKAKTSARLLAALLLLSSMLAACAKAEEQPKETTPPIAADTTSGESDTEEFPAPEIEDMKGATLTILNYRKDSFTWANTTILVEEETGDAFNDALYNRESRVEYLYNCSIEENQPTDLLGTLNKTVAAQDDAYDVAMVFDANVATVLLADVLMSWDALDLDFSKPWWDSAATEQYNFYGIQAAVTGAYSLYNYSTRHTMLFNDNMKRDLNISDDFYQVVRDGKWTLDAMYQYAAVAVNDVNGDGKMRPTDDCYGSTGTVTRYYSALLTGAGIHYIDRMEDGTLYYALVGNEFAQSFISKLVEMNTGNDIFTSGTSDIGGSNETIFPNGRALFLVDYVGMTEKIRDLDFDIGFLPPPKYDENQTSYYSLVEGGAQSVLPKSIVAEDFHRIAVILDAFAYYSYKESIPAYIDILLKSKVARNEESAEMLQLVFDHSAYDLGTGVWSAETKNMFTQNIFLPRKNEVASLVAKTEKPLDRKLERFTEAVQELAK